MNLRLLSEDWSLKLFSLGAAVLLFLFVSVENDTPVEVDFRIEYHLADDMMLVSDAPPVVQATLNGPWAKFRSFDMGELAAVLVDLTQAGPGSTRHTITASSIKAPAGMRVVSVVPAEVEVALDRRVERQVIVHGDIADSPAPGFEVTEVQFNPQKVRVVGPATKMQGLDYIATRTIDVAGREESLSVDIDLRPPPPPLRLLDRRVQAFVIIHEQTIQRSFLGVPLHVQGVPRGAAVEAGSVDITLRGPRRLLDGVDKDALLAPVDIAQDVGAAPAHIDKAVAVRADLAERLQVVAPEPRARVKLVGAPKARRRP